MTEIGGGGRRGDGGWVQYILYWLKQGQQIIVYFITSFMYTDGRGLYLSPGALFHFAGNEKSTVWHCHESAVDPDRIRMDRVNFGHLDPDPGGQK